MKLHTRKVHELVLDNGEVVELTHEPSGIREARSVVAQNGTWLTVVYLVDDFSSPNPIEDGESVSIEWFAHGHDRDLWVDEHGPTLSDERSFWIYREEHGLVNYWASKDLASGGWDVSPGVGVITLDDDWRETEEHSFRDLANGILETYSEWCNGSVYGVVIEEYERSGDAWVHVGEEVVFGLYGIDCAIEWMETHARMATESHGENS